jgi:hypothetical protein
MRPSCKWWCKGDQSSLSSYDAVVPVPSLLWGRGTIHTQLVRGAHHGAHEFTPTPNSDLVLYLDRTIGHASRLLALPRRAASSATQTDLATDVLAK